MVVMVFVFMLLVAGSVSAAKGGDPFQVVWDAIHALEQQIADIQLIPGPQGEQGLRGEPGEPGQDAMILHLKDGNGQDLGTLVDSELLTEEGTTTDDRLYTTYLENEGIFLEFLLRTNRTVSLLGGRTMLNSNYGGIYFRNLNCTNDAFLTTQPVPNTLYKAGTRYFKASEESLTLGSWPRATASRYINDCQNTGDASPLYILDEVSLPFTEPIAWPLRIVEE